MLVFTITFIPSANPFDLQLAPQKAKIASSLVLFPKVELLTLFMSMLLNSMILKSFLCIHEGFLCFKELATATSYTYDQNTPLNTLQNYSHTFINTLTGCSSPRIFFFFFKQLFETKSKMWYEKKTQSASSNKEDYFSQGKLRKQKLQHWHRTASALFLVQSVPKHSFSNVELYNRDWVNQKKRW